MLGPLLLFFLSCWSALAYNTPDSPSWPTNEVWQSDLASSLSQDASLLGPFFENGATKYKNECETLGTDAYAISRGGDGICMHAHACARGFCIDEKEKFDLPAYVLDARTPQDVAAGIVFASTHNISVSVKTTGHSYQGSSTAQNSLLIWMQNYPKDGSISTNFQDSCKTTNYTVVGINGGETWNDVLEAVQGDYHVVTGGGRTVSAAGGWLQGCGLSFSSRTYGIGIDQVVDFDVVLADGTLVQGVDACNHEDLFWALRGGGGGTFGVVTHVHYKLHPVTPITAVSWGILGSPSESQIVKFVRQWLEYWIEVSPNLDKRWSGFFGPANCFLVFAGTKEEAIENFVSDFNDWFLNTLDRSEMVPGIWGAFLPSDTLFQWDNWYEHKGGASAFNNPDATDATGTAAEGVEQQSARLMPRSVVEERPAEVLDTMVEWALTGFASPINYYLGGIMEDVPVDETAVHPAMRKALWAVHTFSPESGDLIRDFVPNDVTGVSFNHHNALEPDWRNALWGSNYARLAAVKEAYDPNNVFNCWHCVGYQGDEPSKDDSSKDPSIACRMRTLSHSWKASLILASALAAFI